MDSDTFSVKVGLVVQWPNKALQPTQKAARLSADVMPI